MENHYRTLGIPIFADRNQIKAAHTALSRLINRESKDDSMKLNGRMVNSLKVQNAYNVLSDGSSRTPYDVKLVESIFAQMDINHSDGFEQLALLNYSENERIYLAGLHALELGKFRKALHNFKRIMQFERDNTHLLRWIAKTYQAFGYNSFAYKTASKAVLVDPDNEDNYLLLGRIEEAGGNLRSARKNYCTAYKLNPKRRDIVRQFDRGSLVAEKFSRNFVKFLKNFLPDPNAQTLRYQDGLLTLAMVKLGFVCFLSRLHPLPISETFKYSGIY